MKRIHEDKRYNKKSLMAMNVAKEVVSRLQSGSKINLQEITVSKGYSVNSSRAQKAVKTKTFQSLVVPVIERMNRLHEKALISLDNRDLNKERLDSVVNLAKQMLHDSRLVSDKSTVNVANNVVVYGSDDFLALQVDSK